MSKQSNNLVDFSSGELSPKFDARVDLPVYRKGCRQMLNLMAYKQGGMTRRAGTQMIAPTKIGPSPGSNPTAICVPFVFSPDTTFNLESGSHYIRFYSNGQQVQVSSAPAWVSGQYYYAGNYVTDSTNGLIYLRLTNGSNVTAPHSDPTNWVQQTILEIPNTPYNADGGSSGPQPGSIFDVDIRFLAFCAVNDVVYIASPSYAPCKLVRYGDVDWQFQYVNFLTPALLDQNATDIAIAASATTGEVTLTATAPNWATATYYTPGDSVTQGGLIYNCLIPHVSGTFATDLSNGDWQLVNIFITGMEGGTWQLAIVNNATYLEVDGVAATGFTNGTSGTIEVIGGWEVHTYGVWSSDIEVQQSLDQGSTWTTVEVLTSRSDANYDVTGTADVLSLYRFNILNSQPLTGITVTAGSFVTGDTYTIVTVGSTNFVAIGAPSNTVGVTFVATGAGSGTGTAALSAAGVTNPRVVFTIDNAFIDGLVKILSITDAYHAIATVVTQLLNTSATTYWSEAAWSNYRGFPAAVTSFQQRIIYGGSGFEPQRIWGTVTDDIENFDLGDQSLATDSFAFDLNAASRGPIQSLAAQLDLFVLFSGAEWVVNSGSTNADGQSSGAAITPTSVNAVESSSWGSAVAVQPAIIGDVLMFTQRQATSLRQMLFSVYSEKYMTTDLTELADHLFSSGIVQIAYQTRWRKQSIIWVVTQCGTLVGMTYDLDKQITGWHRHQTGFGQVDANGQPITADNGFESVAVIPGQGNNDDEVWVVANRLIGGSPIRFIERINPYNWEEDFIGAPYTPAPFLPDAYYVDCGMQILTPGSTTLTGLAYLNGRYVVGLADGTAFGPLLVAAGRVTLPPSIPATVSIVQVGLPIPYAGEPMRLDAAPNGANMQGVVKQIDEDFYIRVWNAAGGQLSNGTAQLPQWYAPNAYPVGAQVLSTINQAAYQCAVSTAANSQDPFIDTTHWVQIPTPPYMPPVPIKYPPLATGAFGPPTLITTPTDIKVPPQLMPSPGHDPRIVVQGQDALPITVLALIAKVGNS